MAQPRVEANTNLNRVLSERLAEQVEAQPRDCYRNAVMGLLTQPWLEDAVYVEGHARPHDLGIPFEHGWLEMPDGSVVDPTWVLLHDCVVEYYAGERYTRPQVFERMASDLPLSGMRSRAMHAASYWAMRAALGGDAIDPEQEAKLRTLYRMDDE